MPRAVFIPDAKVALLDAAIHSAHLWIRGGLSPSRIECELSDLGLDPALASAAGRIVRLGLAANSEKAKYLEERNRYSLRIAELEEAIRQIAFHKNVAITDLIAKLNTTSEIAYTVPGMD